MTLDLYACPTEDLGSVPVGLRFCGRIFTGQELELICEIARDYAGLAVTEMARTVSELLEWKRANGQLKDQECRQLLEHLRDQGELRLPPVRNSGPRGPRQIPLHEASASQAKVEGSAGEFEPLEMRGVESREESRLWTLSGAIRAEGKICPRLFVVVLAGLEDGGPRSVDRLERGAKSAQSTVDRE
jgi:hypothetical protein